MLAHGIRARSSHTCTAASFVVTGGLWILISQTALSELRVMICANVLWAALATIGLSFQDPVALMLRVLAAAMFPLATLFTIVNEPAAAATVLLRILYVVLLALLCLLIARLRRNLWFLYAFGGMVGVSAYAGAVNGFHRAVAVIGRQAMTAFVWSSGALLLALLISAQKARWLPRKIWPRWRNGNGIEAVLKHDAATDGLSADAPS
jgi:hypothetical protein